MLLVNKQVVTALKINDQEIRYDFMEKPHAHFQCNACSKIYDVDIDTDIYKTGTIHDHLILETQIQFKGYCKYCRV
jgi:Fur family ferric uptake transcriptional regulator/Fur family peroxide stress response transcriptional regulator